jgi:hypothetical protein
LGGGKRDWWWLLFLDYSSSTHSSWAGAQFNKKKKEKKSCFPFCSRLAFSRVETYQTAAATDVCATITHATVIITIGYTLSLSAVYVYVFSRIIIGRVAENKLYCFFFSTHLRRRLNFSFIPARFFFQIF